MRKVDCCDVEVMGGLPGNWWVHTPHLRKPPVLSSSFFFFFHERMQKYGLIFAACFDFSSEARNLSLFTWIFPIFIHHEPVCRLGWGHWCTSLLLDTGVPDSVSSSLFCFPIYGIFSFIFSRYCWSCCVFFCNAGRQPISHLKPDDRLVYKVPHLVQFCSIL